MCVADNKGTTSEVMTDHEVAVTGADSINTGLKHTESPMISKKTDEPPATQVVVNSEANASHYDDSISMTSQSSHAEEDKIYQNDKNLYTISIPSDGDIGFTADCSTSNSRKCVVKLLQKNHQHSIPAFDVMT